VASGSTGTGLSSFGIVINEVSGVGADWVELFNAGGAAVDLSGFRIADDDAGAPKLAEAVSLPSGTIVDAGGYLFVLADQGAAAMPGAQTTCAPGPSPCFHASFGISKSGDVVYLLDAADQPVDQVVFPAGVADGQTIGRLPNGSGDFAPNKPTPGAVNAAP
jgi:hypothetical protein